MSAEQAADHRARRGWPAPSDTLALVIPAAIGTPIAGTCWDCGRSNTLAMRPDAGMRNVTDEIVCAACGEVQPDPDGGWR